MNINNRLSQLRARRSGVDRADRLAMDAAAEVLARSRIDEAWQKRAKDQPYTRYCLGGMQAVDSDYTRISIETAERVGNQLVSCLQILGIPIQLRLQGSVALDVHIRGVSDVDLLTLVTDFYTYDRRGQMSLFRQYNSPSTRTSLSVLGDLRTASQRILKDKFPAATVDISGSKAVTIFGGSLARPVDVVPSHWHDTAGYQSSRLERDRGVTILDRKIPKTIDNLPFLHIHRINERDKSVFGGLKKAIRLCKNVKNDAIEEGNKINFPSFDIAATMYHADSTGLQAGLVNELAILAETQRFLDELYHDETKAKSLMVPDGSRRIFDTEEKYQGLRTLSYQMDELAIEVAKEQSPLLRLSPQTNNLDTRRVLRESYVPGR